MEKLLKLIYEKDNKIIDEITEIVFHLRRQNTNKALKLADVFLGDLSQFLQLTNGLDLGIDENEIITILGEVELRQKNQDYVMMADLYENMFLPIFDGINKLLLQSDFINYLDFGNYGNYTIEPTSQGCNTVKIIQQGKEIYFHSNNYPTMEALHLAYNWYSSEKYHYVVYGLGLGYHILKLAMINEAITVDVYEASKDMMHLARDYGVLNEIEDTGRVKIHLDTNFEKISEAEIENEYTSFVVHNPSVRAIENEKIREWFENSYLEYISMKNQELCLLKSFNENVKHSDRNVDELKEKFEGKDVYIIAAGPSLDKNFMQLKNVGKNGVIVSTGTVLRKLIKNGIVPDYVIHIDANDITHKQIDGVENCGVPMIFLATANYKTVSDYKADRYIVYQKGYDKSETAAKEKGVNLYNTGGSVTTLAIDIMIQMKCRRLICVGLDLALTNGFNHATETAQFNKVSEMKEFYRNVPCTDGGYVATTKGFDGFRKWIESRIVNVQNIEIIDATEGGALIKGMVIKKLEECIKI